MKKRILSAMMLSTVVLSAGASTAISTVHADTDSDIAAQDAKISQAKSESAKAQGQVDTIQGQVDSLQAKQASNKATLEKLQKESADTSKEITKLAGSIKERNGSLEAQARSAQTNGTATNLLSAVLDSSSLTDAIQRVTAMTTVANANKSMLDQQKKDQEDMQAKLKANQAKYSEATKLQESMAAQAQELNTQQAQLKVAQLNYQASITTAQDKKQSILDAKAQAEAAAKAAAAAQAAQEKAQADAQAKADELAKAAQAQQQQTAAVAQTPASSTSQDNNSSSSQTTGNTTPTPAPTPGTSGSNPYPWGQCTWGVWQILGGNMPTYSGNAADWVAYANSGLAVGTIAVFPPGVDGAGGFGHVGVVTSVSGNSFTVSESNFNGGLGIISSRTIPSTAGVSFIRP
ncbi:CHAP domain-containing protein [Lactococcus termiticola]|uniref:Surface antigen n=1 Tax=Lactococcus termiticola TaxID=2169526 RepID=A0A2R5HKR8_9LACT|nr:CHAP domain-containing protein [Lactococcus termiticola]GBG97530.1 surface antigen [Lactococcus termiticola]